MDDATLLQFAAKRCAFRARHVTDPTAAGEHVLLPLWHQPTDADRKAIEGWCFLQFQRAGWTAIVRPAPEVVFVADAALPQPLPAVDLATPIGGSDLLALLEGWSLAARTRTTCRFLYRKVDAKPGEGAQERLVSPLSVRDDTLFGLDLEREGALRGYKIRGVSLLRAVDATRCPRWDGEGYRLPGVDGG